MSIVFQLKVTRKLGIKCTQGSQGSFDRRKAPNSQRINNLGVQDSEIVTAQPQPQPKSTSTRVGIDKVISWTTHTTHTTPPTPHLNF